MLFYIIHGLDGTEGNVLGSVESVAEGLQQIKRLLGSTDNSIKEIYRGDDCYIFNFIRNGLSEYIKMEPYSVADHVARVYPLSGVIQPHVDYTVFA